MLKVIVQIIIGWSKKYKVIETTPAEQKLSELRLAQCSACTFSKVSSTLKIINGVGEHTSQLYCGQCKCPCIQATLVVDKKCPVGKW